MAAAANEVVLRDGRTLSYLERGDEAGKPVFVLHASLGSKLLYAPHVADATRRGIRLIGHDRAGYGDSSAKPGRAVVDEAADVLALADELGIDRFAVWGNSTGGSLALACGAKCGDRLVGVASIAGVAPFPAEGLDWFSGVDPEIISDYNFYRTDPVAWRRKMTADVGAMKNTTVEQMRASLSNTPSAPDRSVLSPELVEFACAQLRDGLSHGPEGWIDDYVSGLTPWGFELGSITTPLLLWHGLDDPMVPRSHANWLAGRLPRAEVRLEPNEGHVSLFANKIPEVHAWLLSHF